MKIKKWLEYITEQVDWYVSGSGGVNTNTLPYKTLTDPSLSMDAWDRQKSQLLQAKDQMRWVLQTTFGDANQMINCGGDLEKMVINRIIKNVDGLTLNIHLTFEIDGVEYWARIEGYNSFNPKLIDEYSPQIPDKIIKQRFIATIFKFIDIFFKPEPGKWKALTEVRLINDWNMETIIKPGTIVQIGRNWIEQGNPSLEVFCKDKLYYIQGLDYYWVRWRFEELVEGKVKKLS